MKTLLETIDLRKTYRVGKIDVEALRGVNLRIREGELAAIMGPSGCGKSSLMHILGAMTKATSGKVLIEGSDIAGMNDGELTAHPSRQDRFRLSEIQSAADADGSRQHRCGASYPAHRATHTTSIWQRFFGC